MANINNLVVFAENGERDITGLNQTNGFPAALKPARQWFNFLFNSLTSKVNEIITQVNTNKANVESISSVLPGTTVLWCAPVLPDGYLELAGQPISRTTYSALFALFGTTYGSGNGSTTFNLPDLRGEFVRGWDHGRGIDAGRTLGSTQNDAIRNITGNLSLITGGGGGTGVFTSSATVNQNHINAPISGTDSSIEFDASLVVPTDNENRPRNIALMYIIKT